MVKIGSEAHKTLFCESFIASHLNYEPRSLPFPDLDEVNLERLQRIPFWEEALSTEREAGSMVSAFANTIQDPEIHAAIALQGREEARHARLLDYLIERYNISLVERPLPALPKHIDRAFIDFGFGECLDSFFAFGMFNLAKQANYLPDSLFAIFDPLLDEEARHIVFFVNWISYLQVQQGRGAGLLRGLHAGWYYSRALSKLGGMVLNAGGGSQGFTATGAKTFVDDLTAEQFFNACLQENARRMSQFDDRLLQPQLLSRLSAIALSVLHLLPRKSAPGQAQPSTSV